MDMPTMESRRSVSCSSSPTGCLSWVSDLLSMKCRLRASCMLGLLPCNHTSLPCLTHSRYPHRLIMLYEIGD